jgi:predicted enzyme related to lactoylglutathione lyase
LDVFRVRLVVEDFPAALPFYATLIDGACVTKAPDVDAAHIWTDRSQTGRSGADIVLLSTEVAARDLGEHLAAPGVTLVCFSDDVDTDVERLVRAGGEVVDEPRDVAPGATRFARVRAADGCLVEITKPQVPTWGPLPQPVT